MTSDKAPAVARAPEEYGRPLSEEDKAYLARDAYRIVNAIRSTEALRHAAEDMWRLCLWERDRQKMLDDKSAKILGLSGLAAVTLTLAARGNWITAGLGDVTLNAASLMWIALVAFLGFAATVFFFLSAALSLIASRPRRYGNFLYTEALAALQSSRVPVGVTPRFWDHDTMRCYLRELILQRAMVVRWYVTENDKKAGTLRDAQHAAIVLVCALLLLALLIVLAPWFL